MKYVYAAGHITAGKEKLYLDLTSEQKPFIKNITRKEKIYIEKLSLSHFTWVHNRRKWTLKIYREQKAGKVKVWDRFRNIIVDGCLCSLSSESIS